ncbi:MAG: rane dipeptidase [Candidatus Sumerlaeota bacterium]|nr:rane dipeptidase [Candidatus Sumerlaeota bacterium]
MRTLLALLLTLPLLASCARTPQTGEVPVMDLHTDILYRAIDHGVDIGNAPEWTAVNTRTMALGNVQDEVLSVWVDSSDLTGLEATHRALRMIDLFNQQAARHADKFALATTVAESDRIRESGRVAMWLWLEGGAPINDDLALLRTFHQLGVRGMTLTWSNNLSWAGSSSDKHDATMGLTEFGREVVREMNRLNMIVDVSHVSEQTFYDTLAITSDPVIATHSGCMALCNHDRNLTDDQLRALAANGGVVGIPVLPTFLKKEWEAGWEAAEARIADKVEALKQKHGGNTRSPDYREARRLMIQAELAPEAVVTLDDYLDHIEHAVAVAGPEHVAIGSDFDGIWAFPVGIEKASDWPKVVEGLRARGMSDDVIRGIMSENARRVFRQVLDK